MTPALRRARTGLALLLALSALDTGTLAHAKDEDSGPRVRFDEARLGADKSEAYRQAARAARIDAIERLKALLAEAPEGDRKAEMMLRLASLYYEEASSLYLAEMATFTEAFDKCFNTEPDAGVCERTIKPQNDESNGWFTNTAKLYKAIIRGYPQYSRADEATFYLGMTENRLKQVEAAQDSFKRLVKLYPSSNYVPDAYVLIGDYYFDDNQAFPALRAYLKAASYTDHERYGYANYKLAWSYYNVEEYGKAIDTMKLVVEHSMAMRQSEGPQSGILLENEALRDLVRFFADAGAMEEALSFFTQLGRPDLYRSSLKRLAGLYFEQGKFRDSIAAYRHLINEDPNHVENPGYQEEIIQAQRRMGDKGQVLEEIRRLRSDYGRTSAWWRANAGSPDAQKGADETIEKALRTTATEFNREARELRKSRHPRADEGFQAAVDAYYVYLEDYGETKAAYNVHYDFGELLYLLKRYDEAYREYMKVVEMDPNGQHSRFCAESAIFAAEEMVKAEGGGGIQAKGIKVSKDVQPVPLTEWEQRMVDACAQYAKLYPQDSKVENAIYKSAFLLYQRYHFPAAAELFRDVIAMNPKSKNAEYSANLILDALNIREEWVSLRDTARSFYEQQNLGSNAFKKDMYNIYSAASFTVIEKDFEQNQDHAKTADAFVAFYETFPEFEKADYALNNAAAYYYQSNRVADSMKVRHILVEDPRFAGKSRFFYSQVANLGFDYERLADFESAARYYDKLLELYPEERKKVDKAGGDDKADRLAALDSQAADALYSSAVFRNALGDWEGAIERYRGFVAAFPSDERVADVHLIVARIYEDHARHDDAAAAFRSFYTKDAPDAPAELTFFARLHEGRALLAQGKTTEAQRLYRASIEAYNAATAKGLQPGAHTEFVAEMMFELAKGDADAYAALQIKGSGTRNQRAEDRAMLDSLKKKTGALLDLEKTYRAIIQTGAGEWGLASLVALGKAYQNMATTLLESPCPFYLTDDQCEFYRLGLQDRAYVQTEKAVEAYGLALQKSYELNIYNENAAFATRQLGELRPEDFPGLFETLPKPGLTADKLRVFDVEKSLE